MPNKIIKGKHVAGGVQPHSLNTGLALVFQNSILQSDFIAPSTNLSFSANFSTTRKFGISPSSSFSSNQAFIVNDPSLGIITGNSFTISAWLYPTQNSLQGIVNKWDFENLKREFGLAINEETTNNYKYQFSVSTNGIANFSVYSASAPSFGSWNFILCWYDSSDGKIRLQVDNGTAQVSGSSSTSLFSNSSGANFKIGNWYNNLYPFTGNIQQICLWRRLLTTSEKTDLYNSGQGKIYPFT